MAIEIVSPREAPSLRDVACAQSQQLFDILAILAGVQGVIDTLDEHPEVGEKRNHLQRMTTLNDEKVRDIIDVFNTHI